MTVQLVAVPAKAKADCPAAFRSRAMETDSRRAVAAASFAVRFLPETDPSAVGLFDLCRCSICPATVGFAPAADPFDPAGPAFAAVVAADLFDLSVAAAAAAVVVVDPSAAGPSVVAAGPGSVGSAVFAACLVCSVCSFAVGLGKGMVVVAVPFYFLTHQSSF